MSVTQKNGFDLYTISSADGSAQMTFVPERGGMATSLIFPGADGQPQEFLHCHDFVWDETIEDLAGGWPFVFPICARIARDGEPETYLYDGQRYHMKIHGFSWYLPWEVTKAEREDELVLTLRSNEETLKQYPFSFEVQLHYKISNNQLTCEQVYKNTGNKPMPFAAGFHPYFKVPMPKDQVMLDYQPVRRFKYNETLTDLVGEQELFATPVSIADPAINENLTQIGENKLLKLNYPDGLSLHMQVISTDRPDLFSYVQLYHMPDKPFFCVEPWMSFPNAMNTVAGMQWLEAGEEVRATLTCAISLDT